ncbi:helix-turn-helix transcriptional regulator [Chitinophaga oryzae]|uniref:Helix-turn-helix transcriptional regulator n=1 Tax=Chitinophaga oryzae TaxID=2725414 RepID=A0AAE6ZGB8_9BACT|nr:AraC family transcriptional regulator [Chitinophaga oryzae]QJB31298.1 helix-turn-helix transcriptional regulator [Chitinophaga oryzae]
MKAVHADTRELLFSVTEAPSAAFSQPLQLAEYVVMFIPAGKGVYHADVTTFAFSGPVLLFATPFQLLRLETKAEVPLSLLRFHGDFYCIEHHRAEVACNGLLFNNIYQQPFVQLAPGEAADFSQLIAQLQTEFKQPEPSGIVLKAYLQLLLAKSSAIKLKTLAAGEDGPPADEQMEQFRQLLDQHYLTLHKPADYAELLAVSPNHFTKKCNRYFGKSPSRLIQDRLVLEAKKQLHLTRKSVKEIAYALRFDDEFYFSRFFKKHTGVSPQTFRRRTGISIVADLSMQ